MSKKRKKKRGRKKGTGPKSSINAHAEQPVDIAFKLEHGIREWITPLNAALRKYETNFGSMPDKFLSEINPDEFTNSDWVEKIQTPVFSIEQHDLLGHVEYLWSRHRAEHEEATLRGDDEWYRRQADALEPKGSAAYGPPNLGRFDKAVFDALFIRAHSYDNHEDHLWWARPRFMKEGCTAANILDSLRQRREGSLRQRREGRFVLFVEDRRFNSRKSALDAIRQLAKRFGFGLRSGQGKRSRTAKPSSDHGKT